MSETSTKTQEFDSQSLVIERAGVDDAEAIMNLKAAAWLDTYPNEALGITVEDVSLRVHGEHGERLVEGIENWKKGIGEEDGKTRVTFVARVDGEVAGFVAPRTVDGRRFIGAMYVMPGKQSKGIGGQLMQRALEWHGRDEDIYLHVASYNQRAINFYERFGFETTDTKLPDEIGMPGGKSLPETEMVLKAKSN